MSINPIRYPGGKGSKKIVDRVLSLYPDGYLSGVTWVEPFCGGCGLGLSLLDRGVVDRCVFNDGDIRIHDMWHAIAYDTDRLISDVLATDASIERFRQAKLDANSDESDTYLRGLSTFLLNRWCRSGYIDGGVIGGNDQTGKYKIDCRFNKATLTRNIRKIGDLAAAGKIEFVDSQDAIDFILSRKGNAGEFLYVDPPYVKKGAACYRKGVDHQRLADVLTGELADRDWLLSYDDCDEVREMYDGCRFDTLSITYSNNTQTRGKTDEVLIRPKRYVDAG